MKRIRLIVAYDGTDYCGWQIQNNGPTIEAELNRALTKLLGNETHVSGASRTDSGVHALGNVAVFDTDARIPADKYAFALNRLLPEDISVQGSCEVDADWHPRHCESRKTYEYRILNRVFPDPTRRRDHYFYHYALDIARMRQAAARLEGTHDFQSFCSIHTEAESTVRTIYRCAVEKDADVIRIRVCGSGFLYHMVRIIAGTLMDVGVGKLPPEAVADILAGRDRALAGPTAPAHGLTLMGIEYL